MHLCSYVYFTYKDKTSEQCNEKEETRRSPSFSPVALALALALALPSEDDPRRKGERLELGGDWPPKLNGFWVHNRRADAFKWGTIREVGMEDYESRSRMSQSTTRPLIIIDCLLLILFVGFSLIRSQHTLQLRYYQ